MVKSQGAVIQEVISGSIAAELELEAGDRLLTINGQPLDDFIRFLAISAEEELTIEVLKKSGVIEAIEFEKDSEEPLGLVFEELIYNGISTCKNHCLFCFVHQLPPGQRKTLYVRDDDYRLSFLQGCYITLTNLTEADWQRIETSRLSPLYVSVHATDQQVRNQLLGNKTALPIISQLKRLIAAGITIHTQAVVCPGLNDGAILDQTIKELANLYPGVASLAIVPVGLTQFREKLHHLKPFDQAGAAQVLEIVHRWQKKNLDQLGSRFAFAADEWYLKAEVPLPAEVEYEGFPQLDNGIGLIRWFKDQLQAYFREMLPILNRQELELVVVTGWSAVGMWQEIAEWFKAETKAITLKVLPVDNHFFGPSITVTGLMVGQDLARTIKKFPDQADQVFMIPQITLKQDEAIFLDGMSLTELENICEPKRIEVVPSQPEAWLDWIIKEGSVKV